MIFFIILALAAVLGIAIALFAHSRADGGPENGDGADAELEQAIWLNEFVKAPYEAPDPPMAENGSDVGPDDAPDMVDKPIIRS